MTRAGIAPRLRTAALAALFAWTTFFVAGAPTEAPIPRPEALTPQPALALACADGPSFEGHLTSSSSSTTLLTRSTTGNVFGYLSTVVDDWSCTAWYRYDGLAWTRDDGELDGNFDWGTLINSTSVACNWAVGSTDYLKANSTNDCPDSDAEYAMPIFLANTSTAGDLLEGTFHNDTTPDEPGDFAFIHSDCESYYGAESMRWNHPFSTADTATRPGSNCDPYAIDSTNTTQALVVDGTPPATAFDWPASGTGPTLIGSAFAGVQFDALDAVADFSGTANDWDLQRQAATWSGTACGTFANDTTTGNLTSGVTSAPNQVVSQGLADATCYRWTLAAKDANGNTAATITSGTIRTDLTRSLGQQRQHSFESWDLGGGDTLGVNVGTGNLVITHPITELPIRGGSFSMAATYNRHDTPNVGMGPGWRLDAFRRLKVEANGDVTFTDGDGARHTFINPTGSPVVSYTRPATLYATLTRDTAATPDRFTLTYRDRSKDVFDELVTGSGFLVREEDRFGNGVDLGYVGSELRTITDTAPSPARVINLTWTSGRLTKIEDWAWIDGAGVVQTTATGTRRAHRFFYDGTGALIGWADPLNTSGSCTAGQPSGASHVTCLVPITNGLEVTKTQTVTTLSSGALGTTTRTGASAVTTRVTYANADVTTVLDGQEEAAATAGTAFSHPAPSSTQVVRRGTAPLSLDTTTRYTLATADDVYARVATVARKLTGAANGGWISTATTWDTTYPTEVATVTDDAGGSLARTTTTTYVPSSLGLVAKVVEPLTATDDRWTEYTYNSNNDVTQTTVSLEGSSTQRTITRSCYATSGCSTSATDLILRSTIENYVDGTAGNGLANEQDATTTYQYDAYGQRTRETRANYAAGGSLLDTRATAWTFDSSGNVTAEIRNVIDGGVSSPGADITPDSATNARTDLTTAFTFDTAGNRVSVADPRRAIGLVVQPPSGPLVAGDYVTTTTYDALGHVQATRQPTTPGIVDCTPSPACRTTTTESDELGLGRRIVDVDGTVTAVLYDAAGRATETYQDDDGAGAAPARLTGRSTYDAAGRLLSSEDTAQAVDPAGGTDPGRTEYTYDEAGRTTSVTEAAGSTAPAVASTTATTYDALDRPVTVQAGSESPDAPVTRWSYDAGGRVVDQDEGFTCSTTTSDYRDFASSVVEGRTPGTPCTGTGTRTLVHGHDGLGRLTSRAVQGGAILETTVFDAAGRALTATASDQGIDRVTETTWNALDEGVTEYRYSTPTGGGTRFGESWARANRDAAGNEADRCTWAAAPAEWCHRANDATWATPAPTTRASAAFDARNNRVEQYTPGVGTTTYDPTANYQVGSIRVPTANGREHRTVYAYDGRNRLDTITVQLCAVGDADCAGNGFEWSRVLDDYGYDENDNRTSVTENTGAGAIARTYGYDGRNQLITDSSAGTGCGGQAYQYDAAGNRTCAAGRSFTYVDGKGQLATCSGTACNPVFDADGRLTRITTATGTWSYLYDGDGRLTSACRATSCTGSGFARLDSVYDAEGHRITLTQTPATGTATVTAFTYEGDKVAREVSTTGSIVVTRSFTVDEAGAILKMSRTTTGGSTADDGTYLVTWNGHGDAAELARIDPATGLLDPANRFGYSTWGAPNLSTVGTFGDLGFRYRYVGRFDVQWDSSAAVPAELLYMHARHYHPEFGRFLQPDPSRAEANAYGYASASPVVVTDPSGTCGACIIKLVEALKRAGDAASRWRIWDQLRSLLHVSRSPDLGNKLVYVFGRASGTLENQQKSLDRLRQLNSIGIRDNALGRALVSTQIRTAYWTGRVTDTRLPGMLYGGALKITRTSYLYGPRGRLIMETVWQGNKLVTVILKTPRKGV